MHVDVLDEFYYVNISLHSCNAQYVPVDSIIHVRFDLAHEFDLINNRSSSLTTVVSSLVKFSLVIPVVEDVEVTNNSTKVTCIKSLFLEFFNVIFVLFFLGDMKFSWVHGSLGIIFCMSLDPVKNIWCT